MFLAFSFEEVDILRTSPGCGWEALPVLVAPVGTGPTAYPLIIPYGLLETLRLLVLLIWARVAPSGAVPPLLASLPFLDKQEGQSLKLLKKGLKWKKRNNRVGYVEKIEKNQLTGRRASSAQIELKEEQDARSLNARILSHFDDRPTLDEEFCNQAL
jgi:hypothetical protein